MEKRLRALTSFRFLDLQAPSLMRFSGERQIESICEPKFRLRVIVSTAILFEYYLSIIITLPLSIIHGNNNPYNYSSNYLALYDHMSYSAVKLPIVATKKNEDSASGIDEDSSICGRSSLLRYKNAVRIVLLLLAITCLLAGAAVGVAIKRRSNTAAAAMNSSNNNENAVVSSTLVSFSNDYIAGSDDDDGGSDGGGGKRNKRPPNKYDPDSMIYSNDAPQDLSLNTPSTTTRDDN